MKDKKVRPKQHKKTMIAIFIIVIFVFTWWLWSSSTTMYGTHNVCDNLTVNKDYQYVDSLWYYENGMIITFQDGTQQGLQVTPVFLPQQHTWSAFIQEWNASYITSLASPIYRGDVTYGNNPTSPDRVVGHDVLFFLAEQKYVIVMECTQPN